MGTMPGIDAVIFLISGSQPIEKCRFFLHKYREIFSSRGRNRVNWLCSDVCHRIMGGLVQHLIVRRRRKFIDIFQNAFAFISRGNGFHQLLQPFHDTGLHFFGVCSHCSQHCHRIRRHIIRSLSCLHTAYRHHAGINGTDISAHNCLHSLNHRSRTDNRIHISLGNTSMASLSFDCNLNPVNRCHQSSMFHGYRSQRNLRGIMKAKNCVHIIQTPQLHHLLCSQIHFLCRLKEQLDASVQIISQFCENPGRRQKRGRMCIMSACMHHSRTF